MLAFREWLRREALTLILAAILVALSLNAVLAPWGLRDVLALRMHRLALETKREHQRAENQQLEAEIERLRSDDVYIQRMIRRELGYTRPEELLYHFASDPNPSDNGH